VRDLVAAEGADEIVVATGARPAADGRSGLTTEPIAGWDGSSVLTYDDVLSGSTSLGERILILDEHGDRIAPGLGELLARQGKEVQIVTRWPQLSERYLGFTNEISWVYGNLDSLGVKVTANSWLRAIGAGTVTLYNIYSEREWDEEVDNVVLVTMKYSNDALYKALVAAGVGHVQRVGDAVTPRSVSEATREGLRLAYAL